MLAVSIHSEHASDLFSNILLVETNSCPLENAFFRLKIVQGKQSN